MISWQWFFILTKSYCSNNALQREHFRNPSIDLFFDSFICVFCKADLDQTVKFTIYLNLFNFIPSVFFVLNLQQTSTNPSVHLATQTQNMGIVAPNRSHMTVVLDSSFYSFPESSRCVFHYPPKKAQLRFELLNVGAQPTNKSRQWDQSRGSAHSLST